MKQMYIVEGYPLILDKSSPPGIIFETFALHYLQALTFCTARPNSIVKYNGNIYTAAYLSF